VIVFFFAYAKTKQTPTGGAVVDDRPAERKAARVAGPVRHEDDRHGRPGRRDRQNFVVAERAEFGSGARTAVVQGDAVEQAAIRGFQRQLVETRRYHLQCRAAGWRQCSRKRLRLLSKKVKKSRFCILKKSKKKQRDYMTPRTSTATSEHIRFYFLVFLFYTLVVVSVR